MAGHSKIEWTDASWTPIRARNLKTGKVGWHCEHATTGCEFCYSEGMNKRLGTGLPFKPGHRKDIEIFLDEEMLLAPLRWKKPRMVFVCSMTDLFADFVKDEWIDKIFALMALCPQHTFQVLTKRAERMRTYLSDLEVHRRICILACEMTMEMCLDVVLIAHPDLAGRAPDGQQVHLYNWPLPNVWLGVSAERQPEWDERKEHLRNTPAAVRFGSFEPLLGLVIEPQPLSDFIQWAIVGGESGRNARPMHPHWARSLRDQCAAAGVPFFFKQWGEYVAETALGTEVDLTRLPRGQAVAWGDGKTSHTRYTRIGKKAAGRLLDGKEHNEFPRTHEANAA